MENKQKFKQKKKSQEGEKDWSGLASIYELTSHRKTHKIG